MRRKETGLEGWVRKPPTGVNLRYTVGQSLNALPCKHLDLSFDPKKPERIPSEASTQLGPDYMLPVYPSACPDSGCGSPPPGPKPCQVQLHVYNSRGEEMGTGGSLEFNGQPGYQEPARAPVQGEIILNKEKC